jgi:hypothetical protein
VPRRYHSFSGYEDPLSDEFSYDPDHSELNTTSFSDSANLWPEEPNYLVIECAGLSAIDMSTVEYEVEWDEKAQDWYDWCIPGSFVGAAAAGIGIFAWWRMRGGRREDAPPEATPPPGM